MHARRTIWFWTTVITLAATQALAQGVTVQQPTFSFSSTSTTVSVPDQGSAFMGGISRSAEGRTESGVPMLPFRPFRNQAIGQTRSAASTFVTATIHDFDAMDQALLNSPSSGALSSSPRLRGEPPAAVAGRAIDQHRHGRSGHHGDRAVSVRTAAGNPPASASRSRSGQRSTVRRPGVCAAGAILPKRVAAVRRLGRPG